MWPILEPKVSIEKLIESYRHLLDIFDSELEEDFLSCFGLNSQRDWNVAILIESYNDMLEMRKNIFFLYNNLASPFVRVSLKSIADIGTFNSILVHIDRFKVKYLTILDVSKTIASYQRHPISIPHRQK